MPLDGASSAEPALPPNAYLAALLWHRGVSLPARSRAKTAAKASSASSSASSASAGAADASGSLAGDAAGSVWGWGSAECEQLPVAKGALSDGMVWAPAPLPALAGVRVVQVAAGGLHSLALSSTGQIFAWGCNDNHVLGRLGSPEDVLPVAGFGGAPLASGGRPAPAALVAAGDSHSAAVDALGRVWVWGTYNGADGRLGFSEGVQQAEEPVEMRDTRRHGRVAHLTCGYDHTAVVTESGQLLTWGCGEQGQLGHPVTTMGMRGDRQKAIALRVTPVRVTAREADDSGRVRKGQVPVKAAFAAGYSLWVVTRRDTVLASGLNSFGQLGIGDMEDRPSLDEVPALSNRGVVQIVAGAHHALALTSSGAVYGMGGGDSGQLGLTRQADGLPARDSSVALPCPVTLGGLGGRTATALAANGDVSAAACDDGACFVWGTGVTGHIGRGTDSMDDATEPFRVQAGGLGAARTLQVALGGQHVLAIVAPALDATATAAVPDGLGPEASSTQPQPARTGVTPAAKRAKQSDADGEAGSDE